MNKEINLIYGKRKSVINREKKLAVFQYSAIGSLVVIAIFAIVLFILNRSASLDTILQKQQTAIQQLSFLQNKTGKLMLLKSRIKEIDTLMHGSIGLDQKVSDITGGIPNSVNIDSFVINKKSITLAVSSDSLQPLNQFIDFVQASITAKKIFSKATINSVAADVHVGKYSVTMDATPL